MPAEPFANPSVTSRPGWSCRHWRIMALLILLVGAALRFWQLGAWPPHHDELFTIALARLPLPDRQMLIANDVHPPLFYEIEALWQAAARHALGRDIGLRIWRLCPALLGLTGLAVLLLGFGRLVSRRLALWAGAFWAVSPLAIGYAQNLRNYALVAPLLFSLVLGFDLLERGASRGRRTSGAALFAASGLALLYTHLLTGFFLAALLLPWLWSHRRDWRRSAWPGLAPGACAFFAIGAGFVPWLVHLATQYQNYSGHSHEHVIWARLSDLYETFLYYFPFGGGITSPHARVALMVAFLAFGGMALGAALIRHGAGLAGEEGSEQEHLRWLAGRLGWMILMPFIMAWFFSWRGKLLLFVPMRSLLAAPAVLLLAVGLTWATGRSRRLAPAAALALLGLILLTALHRPLAPANSAYLWRRWRAGLTPELQALNNEAAPAPRVVYPDFWAMVLPPESSAHPLIPFSQWCANPRSRRQRAILIEPITHMSGYGADESSRDRFVLQAAKRVSGYPPATAHDGGEIDAHTSILAPFDADQLAKSMDQAYAVLPEADFLRAVPWHVTALDLPTPGRLSFYSLECEDQGRFWRWTQGERAAIPLAGPFAPGRYEALLCLDRPSPYPQAVAAVSWVIRDERHHKLASGSQAAPVGSPVLLRQSFTLHRPTGRLTLELRPPVWQPTRFQTGTFDNRLLGIRFFWAGLRQRQP